jgi:hypothetical protein
MMSTTHNMKRIVVRALLSGSVALAGPGLSMDDIHGSTRERTRGLPASVVQPARLGVLQ